MENCASCHGARRQKGNLNLQAYDSLEKLTNDADRWELVVQKLRDGDMPPEKRSRGRRRSRSPSSPASSSAEIAKADAARPPGSRPRHRAAAEPHRIQQHGPRPARRRPPPGRRLPAGRCRLRLRQHRRRAVAVAGADGEVPDGGGAGRADRALRAGDVKPTLSRCRCGRPRRSSRDDARRVRRDRPEHAERVPRVLPRAGRRRVRRAGRSRAARGRRARCRCDRALGRRQAVGEREHRPRASARLRSGSSRTSADRRVEFRVKLTAGEHWIAASRASSKACRRATAARSRRRPRAAADGVQAAAERDAEQIASRAKRSRRG